MPPSTASEYFSAACSAVSVPFSTSWMAFDRMDCLVAYLADISKARRCASVFSSSAAWVSLTVFSKSVCVCDV